MSVKRATVKPGVWQRRAKWLAYLSVSWAALLLLFNTLLMVYLGYFTLDIYLNDGGSENEPIREIKEYTWALIWDTWRLTSITTVSNGFTLWMSFRLIRGTKPGRDSREAFALCQNWRNIHIALTVLVAFLKLGGVPTPSILDSHMGLVIIIIPIMWGIPLFIVSMYMRELKRGKL